MAQVQVAPQIRVRANTAASSAIAPVTLWALVGAACLCLTAYILIRWLNSPDFHTVRPPAGVAMPHFVRFWVLWTQILSTSFSVVLIWYWIIKPKVQTGQFSLYGLISLASATVYI